MTACQNCKHWLGKESTYMGECEEHKQRTEFNHSCASFSPRAVSAVVDDKPKINPDGQLKIMYYSGVGAPPKSISFGTPSTPDTWAFGDDYDAAISLDIEPFDTSKYPPGQEFSIPFTFNTEVWDAFAETCKACVEALNDLSELRLAALQDCFYTEPDGTLYKSSVSLDDRFPEAAFYQAECDAIALRAEEDRAAVYDTYVDALAAIDARERDELAILEGSKSG